MKMRETQRTKGRGKRKGNDLIRRCAPPSHEAEGFGEPEEFSGTGLEPRRRMREGYRIFDAGERMWLECRLWYDGLGWVDFWTHKGAQAQRFAGAKSARRMARDLQADKIGALLVVNRKGVVM